MTDVRELSLSVVADDVVVVDGVVIIVDVGVVDLFIDNVDAFSFDDVVIIDDVFVDGIGVVIVLMEFFIVVEIVFMFECVLECVYVFVVCVVVGIVNESDWWWISSSTTTTAIEFGMTVDVDIVDGIEVVKVVVFKVEVEEERGQYKREVWQQFQSS